MRLIILFVVVVFLFACSMGNKGRPSGEGAPLIHTIKYSGETLGAIAAWYTGSLSNWREIAKFNPNLNPNKLRLGDSVMIPSNLVRRTEPFSKQGLNQKQVKVSTGSKTASKPAEIVSPNQEEDDDFFPAETSASNGTDSSETPPDVINPPLEVAEPTIPPHQEQPTLIEENEVKPTPIANATAIQPRKLPEPAKDAESDSHTQSREDLWKELLEE